MKKRTLNLIVSLSLCCGGALYADENLTTTADENANLNINLSNLQIVDSNSSNQVDVIKEDENLTEVENQEQSQSEIETEFSDEAINYCKKAVFSFTALWLKITTQELSFQKSINNA